MKICPSCNQTYSDDSLNFCLNDGSVLNQVNAESTSQQTVMMNAVPVTNRNTAPNNNPPSQQNWNAPAVMAPKKKSRAWLWVLGILGTITLIGIVGFIGLVALVASIDETDNNTSSSNRLSNNPTATLKDDFSKWKKFSNNDASGEFNNGEYTLQSKQANFFYVLVTTDKKFKTSNAMTTLTVRNINASPTNLGYGLLIHGDSSALLSRDYVFLIDSTKQSYRVAKHLSSKEITEIDWTKFSAIRNGTQTNELQVRDENGKMSFYINGQFAVSVNDTIGFKDGAAGIYAGDGVPIAFSNLQLGK